MNSARDSSVDKPKRKKKNNLKHVSQNPAATMENGQEEVLKVKPRSRADLLISTTGFISTFFLIIIAILIYDVVVGYYLDVVDFQTLKTDLTHNVHNQSEALAVILDTLETVEDHDQGVNIINFVGSTGVGKTFTANIIKRHFSLSLYEIRGPLKHDTCQNIVTAIQKRHYRFNLVIVDDLTVNDVDNLLVFLKGFPQDVALLVICVFNIQETDNFLNHKFNYDHIDTIEGKFKTAEISHKVAKFHQFTKEEALAWVVKQLVMKNVDVQLHSKFVDSVLDAHNVKHYGLKGLASKLNLAL